MLNAIHAGLIEVPEGFTPEDYAAAEGKFIPKTVIDRFKVGDTESGNGGRDYVVGRTPIFLYPAINYNSGAAGTQPGWNDPELAGLQGIMGRWRPNGMKSQRSESPTLRPGPHFD